MKNIRHYSDFNPEVQSLLHESILARESAYAPFSKFKVGAALQCKGGEVFTGCNIENSSYPLTTCAERTAVVKAVSEGNSTLKSIAICAILENEFVAPCGSCRQILSEFVGRDPEEDLTIYLVKPDRSDVLVTSLTAMLPLSFNF